MILCLRFLRPLCEANEEGEVEVKTKCLMFNYYHKRDEGAIDWVRIVRFMTFPKKILLVQNWWFGLRWQKQQSIHRWPTGKSNHAEKRMQDQFRADWESAHKVRRDSRCMRPCHPRQRTGLWQNPLFYQNRVSLSDILQSNTDQAFTKVRILLRVSFWFLQSDSQ